jgi:predicted nucleotidyltransferase
MITDAHLDELRQVFSAHGVVLAYLFGSQAEGAARPDSDVDIAVLLPSDSPAKECSAVRLSLTGALMDIFHTNEIDVVLLNEAPALLASEIVRHGLVLYEDPVALPAEQFAVNTLQRYSETQPMREARNADLYTRLEQRIAERALREKRNAED